MKINFHRTSHILFFAGFLPLLSLFCGWVFSQLIPNPYFWVETLSPLMSYALLYTLFDKHGWRLRLFHGLGIVDFPDLNGRWRGIQRSSHKVEGKNVEVISYLEITQTFSTICLRVYYERSQSESLVANFAEFNNANYLFYTYDNEPNSLKTDTMKTHKGTTKLKYLPKENKLIGSYFNSLGNSGEVMFEFDNRDLLSRFL